MQRGVDTVGVGTTGYGSEMKQRLDSELEGELENELDSENAYSGMDSSI